MCDLCFSTMVLNFFVIIAMSLLHVCAENVAKDVEINADKISYNRAEKTATATGNVSLSKLETGDQLNLTCLMLTAYFAEDGALQKAVAQNNIVFTKGELQVNANTCTYFKVNNRLEASGHVQLHYNKNKMWGDLLSVDLERQFFTVTAKNSPNGLVKAHIYVKSKAT